MGKYKISDTTREQREKLIDDATAIAELSGTKLSKDDKELINLYIEGKLEIEDVKKMIIEKYTVKMEGE